MAYQSHIGMLRRPQNEPERAERTSDERRSDDVTEYEILISELNYRLEEVMKGTEGES